MDFFDKKHSTTLLIHQFDIFPVVPVNIKTLSKQNKNIEHFSNMDRCKFVDKTSPALSFIDRRIENDKKQNKKKLFLKSLCKKSS